MSEEEFSPIRPKSVPLSHTRSGPEQQPTTPRASRLPQMFGGVVLLLLTIAVFVILPDLVSTPTVAPTLAPGAAPEAATPAADPALSEVADGQPAPFAALLREQARKKAQAELAEFVELQLALEESMQVGAWGQAEYDAAKTLASAGDEQFLKENFEAALASYDAAAVALAALIDTGAQLLATALEDGETALLERNETSAREHFEFALTIDPDNEQARRGAQRADLLPEVIVLLRQGKNHELSGNWTEALATYQTVEKIDPATAGLGEALATARTGVVALRFREHLSDGFAAMQANRFEQARSAFKKALALKPGNSVALGGLEQVSQRTDLSRIESLKQEAIAAEAREEWPAAITGYEAVLALDTNIQFAKDGRARAATQYRTGQALGKIIASPDKLSSPRLFNEAKNILARAEQLSPRKENLAAQINSVHNLISIYSVPVEVTFHSDNATNVTLSTVGVLGAFAEKRVTLRPGAYTVIGSRDGCRDVRESIVVRPEMQPIDIRCVETF